MTPVPETLEPGVVHELAPGRLRLVAPNAGLMTGPGTNTYLLGDREVAVLDPGPAIAEHIDAIVAAAPGPIRWILATHTHLDHSPAVAPLAERTGAEVLGRPAPDTPRQDRSFRPDRVLDDGEALVTPELRLEAVATPGHASNHLCYYDAALGWLFTGDHLINGSTVVIDPPDGSMRAYLDSLARLRSLRLEALAPGHGALVTEPRALLEWTLEHRLAREAKVVAALERSGPSALADLLLVVYDDVDPRLRPVAERSLLAHLIKLRDEGRARLDAGQWSVA